MNIWSSDPTHPQNMSVQHYQRREDQFKPSPSSGGRVLVSNQCDSGETQAPRPSPGFPIDIKLSQTTMLLNPGVLVRSLRISATVMNRITSRRFTEISESHRSAPHTDQSGG